MALTSGFFDAQLVNDQPDRVYSSENFGSLFDGVITDGIFENYRDAFKVTVTDPDVANGKLRVNVGPGRAWFNKTWTLNTAAYTLDVDKPETTGYRLDVVVLEVDTRLSKRKNTIKVIKGVPHPTQNLSIPILTRERDVNQYLLATIQINESKILTKDAMIITDQRKHKKDMGNNDQSAPYAETVIPTDASVDSIIKSLEKEFNSYQKKYKKAFNNWMDSIVGQLGTLSNEQTVRLSLMIGELYRSEYISGEYPYVDDEGGLWLSASDNGEKPQVDINFGYASLPYSANGRAREVVIQSSQYTIS